MYRFRYTQVIHNLHLTCHHTVTGIIFLCMYLFAVNTNYPSHFLFIIVIITVEPRFNDIPGITISIRFPGKSYSKMYGAEPRFNDLRFNDIPVITINIRFPGKSYSKMYGAEPRFNDLRFNDIPGITVNIGFPGKSYSKMYGAEPRLNDLRFNNIPGITINIRFPGKS